jgi:hypothetical protein
MPYALKADTRKARQLTRLQKAALNTTGGLMHANNQPTQDTSDPHQKADAFQITVRNVMMRELAKLRELEDWWNVTGWIDAPDSAWTAIWAQKVEHNKTLAEYISALGGLMSEW